MTVGAAIAVAYCADGPLLSRLFELPAAPSEQLFV